MEDVLLVDVDIDGLVAGQDLRGDEVLDGVDLVVDEVLAPLHIPGEPPHPVVHDDDVGVEAVDKEVQGLQGGDVPAGGDVDVRPEGADPLVGMAFWIGVDGDVALVQVGHHRLLGDHGGLLGDKEGDARPLGLVVLAGDVEDVGADHPRHLLQDGGQALGVVGLVDVVDVGPPLRWGPGVADVVDVEAQGLGEVVEAVELEFFQRPDLRCLMPSCRPPPPGP